MYIKQYSFIVIALIAWVSLFLLLGRFWGDSGLRDFWAIMLVGSAIIVYFSILALPPAKYREETDYRSSSDWIVSDGKIPESRIRLAVMSSLLVTYLVYFGSVVYLDTDGGIVSMSESILPTLTQLLTVTISFYFGSTAAIEIFKIKNRQNNPE